MIRLHVTVEGKTEQEFVKTILAPHLASYKIYTDARCVLTSSSARKMYRGGLMRYIVAKQDIARWMVEDKHAECRFTTMFDFYALPSDFPGYDEAMSLHDPYAKVEKLEGALQQDMSDKRFLPYIQLHEFETLILSDPIMLCQEYPKYERSVNALIKSLGEKNPELINDRPDCAPSKRILASIPEYNKIVAGVAVTELIGLPVLRKKCRHFNDWLTQLEKLGASA